MAVRTLPTESCREPAQLVGLAAQIAALSQLHHPHVLSVLGGSTVPPHCYLIMPRAEHGSVGELLHTPAVRTLSTAPQQP